MPRGKSQAGRIPSQRTAKSAHRPRGTNQNENHRARRGGACRGRQGQTTEVKTGSRRTHPSVPHYHLVSHRDRYLSSSISNDDISNYMEGALGKCAGWREFFETVAAETRSNTACLQGA